VSKRVRVHGESTRQVVLDAAIRKFSEKSFLGATTIQIADEAGVSEKTIFDLFGDKKTLYLEVREYIRRSAIRDMLPRLPIGGGAPAILRALGREFLREVRGDCDRARVSIQAITAIDDPGILPGDAGAGKKHPRRGPEVGPGEDGPRHRQVRMDLLDSPQRGGIRDTDGLLAGARRGCGPGLPEPAGRYDRAAPVAPRRPSPAYLCITSKNRSSAEAGSKSPTDFLSRSSSTA
jgi:AcrR family transcriptional regulator